MYLFDSAFSNKEFANLNAMKHNNKYYGFNEYNGTICIIRTSVNTNTVVQNNKLL